MTNSQFRVWGPPDEARIEPAPPRLQVGSRMQPSNSSVDQGSAQRRALGQGRATGHGLLTNQGGRAATTKTTSYQWACRGSAFHGWMLRPPRAQAFQPKCVRDRGSAHPASQPSGGRAVGHPGWRGPNSAGYLVVVRGSACSSLHPEGEREMQLFQPAALRGDDRWMERR